MEKIFERFSILCLLFTTSGSCETVCFEPLQADYTDLPSTLNAELTVKLLNSFVALDPDNLDEFPSSVVEVLEDHSVTLKQITFSDTTFFTEEVIELTHKEQPYLMTVFKVRGVDPADLDRMNEIKEDFLILDEVEYAQINGIDLEITSFPQTSSDDPFTDQRYIQSDPGINALAARTDFGADGDGINYFDCGYSWLLSHQEFDGRNLSFPDDPIWEGPEFNFDRCLGTATAAIAFAGGPRMQGISPGATANFFSEVPDSSCLETNSCRYEAVYRACIEAVKGDILLLQMQSAGVHPCVNDKSGIDAGPVDLDATLYQLIKLCTEKGIVVIQPAGNGCQNLGALSYSWYHHWDNTLGIENGAITVGAGSSDEEHSRLSFSTYDSTSSPDYLPAVDVQSWGENVFTAGYGNSRDQCDSETAYTSLFSGTTSASAIVAAAAAAIQSHAKNKFGEHRLSSRGMKEVLVETSYENHDYAIGPSINMLKALEYLDQKFLIRSGWCTGQSHFRTLDGFSYDFHGRGIFYLLYSPTTDTFVQIALRSGGNDGVNAIEMVAFEMGSIRVSFEYSLTGNSVDVYHDREPIGTNDLSNSRLEFLNGPDLVYLETPEQTIGTGKDAESSFGLRSSNGLKALVNVHWTESFGISMDVHLQLHPKFMGKTKGLIGTYNGDPDDDIVGRGGEEELNAFGESWYVPMSNSLFMRGSIDSGPTENPSIDDYHEDDILDAKRQCCESPSDVYDNCILDVLIGSDEWTNTTQYKQFCSKVAQDLDVMDCYGNGACRNGICECFYGSHGTFCHMPDCAMICLHDGICARDGFCHCDVDWTGHDCSFEQHHPQCELEFVFYEDETFFDMKVIVTDGNEGELVRAEQIEGNHETNKDLPFTAVSPYEIFLPDPCDNPRFPNIEFRVTDESNRTTTCSTRLQCDCTIEKLVEHYTTAESQFRFFDACESCAWEFRPDDIDFGRYEVKNCRPHTDGDCYYLECTFYIGHTRRYWAYNFVPEKWTGQQRSELQCLKSYEFGTCPTDE